MKRLEQVNQPNQSNQREEADAEFETEVGNKIQEVADMKDDLVKQKERLNKYMDTIEQIMEPLSIMNEREVPLVPEIEEIFDKLKGVNQELADLEGEVVPNN